MRRAGAGWLTAIAAVVAGTLAGVASTEQGIVGGTSALILMAAAFLILDLRLVVTVWGAMLPIWSIGSLDPFVFDLARFGGAVIIAFRCIGREPVTPAPLFTRWFAPLFAVAVLLTVLGETAPDAKTRLIGLTMLVSVTLAWAVARNPRLHTPLLQGYVAGVSLSALVIGLAALGVQTISPQASPGLSRITGLGPSAPLVSYELAFGVVIALSLWRSARSSLFLGLAVLALAALLLCGGRGGLLGLALAAVVALRHGWLTPTRLLGAAAVIGSGLWLAGRSQVSLNTLTRLEATPGGTSDITSGRLELVARAWAPLRENLFTGIGISRFEERYAAAPHVAPLNFALAGGIVAGAIILALSIAIAMHAVRPAQANHAAGPVILGVCLAWIAVEPLGPFVGVEGLTLLLVAVSLTSRLPDDGGLPGRGRRVDGRSGDVGDAHLHRVGG